MGGEISAFFTVTNASSWSEFQINELPDLRSGRRTFVVVAMSIEKSVSWFTNPIKDLSCVILFGLGNRAIAETFSRSTEIPSFEIINPANSPCSTANLNFNPP